MNNRMVLWSALAVTPVVLAAAGATAASDADRSTLASAPGATPARWLVRAEGSLVAMRDNWLSLPMPEVGLTVGRDLMPRFSVELTGSAKWTTASAARGPPWRPPGGSRLRPPMAGTR